MNALRLSVATAVTAIVAAAAAMGACGGPDQVFSICGIPTMGEVNVDGGSDPCHCDPPPSLNITTCPCLTGGQQGVDVYEACMATYREELAAADGGADGGPIPGCTGSCWPIAPLGWMGPVLLWVGPESTTPPCPASAPAPVFGGFAGDVAGSFGLACTSNATGPCPDPGDSCGPAAVPGYWPCVYHEGDVDCALVGPYDVKHVFFETQSPPTNPSTLCCPAAPLPTH